MSKNHGPIRFRNEEGKIQSVDNPNWRKVVKKRRNAKSVAKQSKKTNRGK